MDSISQAVLGAAVQTAILGKHQQKKAILYGAVLATLPDLDVVFLHYANEITGMTTHRSFTHSIFVLSFFSLLLCFLIWKFRPKLAYSAQRLFWCIWFVLVTHPLLDSLTVYGTQLFWPLEWTPVALTSVYIVDPIYTVPLLALCIYVLIKGVKEKTPFYSYVILVLTTAYLAFGCFSRIHAENKAKKQIEALGEKVVAVMGTPTVPLTNMLWRVLVKTDDGHYYEVYSSLFDDKPGEYIKQSLHNELLPFMKDDPDYKRLYWFTNGWVRLDLLNDKIYLSDLRMGDAQRLFFTFEMYQKNSFGKWYKLNPHKDKNVYLQNNVVSKMKMILKREFNENDRVPLEKWSEQNVFKNTLIDPSLIPKRSDVAKIE